MNKPAVEMVATDKLIPYARNAKKHDEAQVSLIAGSIRQFGFNNPILIAEDNGIVAGHGRVLAAMKLGMAEVPCIRLSHLDENQRRAYILADNRLAELGGGWDLDMLAAEVESIDWEELESFGLDDMDLGEILAEAERGSEGDADAEPQVDRAEELNRTWGVKAGDLWLIGSHRLLCGDSTKADDVARAMGGETASCVFTDPPYGVGMEIENDDLKGAEFDSFNRKWISAIPRSDNCGFVCYHSTRTFPSVLSGAVENGWKFERMLWYYIPDKFPAHSWNHWMMVSQSILLFSFGSVEYADAESDQDCYKTTSAELGTKHGHPTEKRIGNATRVMSHYAGAHIYDPFLGSGTTMVAGQNLGRRVFGLEISPAYCAVILQRMADAFPGIEIRKADA